MSEETVAAALIVTKLRDLAASIYVDLCGQSVSITDNAVKMTASPENLAKLSFKLATAFTKVSDEVNAENMPKNPNFKLQDANIAEWSK
jgi:hypothetical protein